MPFFSEFNWVEYSGHYYFFGAENVTWIDAKVVKRTRILFFISKLNMNIIIVI